MSSRGAKRRGDPDSTSLRASWRGNLVRSAQKAEIPRSARNDPLGQIATPQERLAMPM
jgi:hypothetical protein